MTEQIQRKLSESKTARWSVLALVAFTMLCGYFITDMMAPLQDLLQTPVEGGGLGWTANEYGKFTSAYGWFNVFFLMLIFGGMILDKMGVRFTGLMATSIMLIGVFIKWFGISHNFDGATVTVFGSEYGYPLVIASLGYALFGVDHCKLVQRQGNGPGNGVGNGLCPYRYGVSYWCYAFVEPRIRQFHQHANLHRPDSALYRPVILHCIRNHGQET